MHEAADDDENKSENIGKKKRKSRKRKVEKVIQ